MASKGDLSDFLDQIERRPVDKQVRDLRNSKRFETFNERRAYLIDKELKEGLSKEEGDELRRLQSLADRYLDARSSIRMEDLSWLEARVQALKEA